MIEIVPATMEHARAIQLRTGDAAEIAALDVTKEAAVQAGMNRAIWTDAYLAEGEVAAIAGLSVVSALGGQVCPWLITGVPVERHKRDFLRLTRERVHRMRAEWPALINYVHADYREAVRWLRWLGFAIGPAQPYGPRGALFHRATIGVV